VGRLNFVNLLFAYWQYRLCISPSKQPSTTCGRRGLAIFDVWGTPRRQHLTRRLRISVFRRTITAQPPLRASRRPSAKTLQISSAECPQDLLTALPPPIPTRHHCSAKKTPLRCQRVRRPQHSPMCRGTGHLPPTSLLPPKSVLVIRLPPLSATPGSSSTTASGKARSELSGQGG
jgi:hypothetical protein